jgi:hypothetical protein
MSYKNTIHLILTVFDGGKVVMRDTLVHTRALTGWYSVSGAPLRGPLPPPERASAAVTFVVGGRMRCTVANFSARSVGGTDLRFTRAAFSYKNAALVDIISSGVNNEDGSHRVNSFAKINDAFLNDLL